jgi:hypothetical protein
MFEGCSNVRFSACKICVKEEFCVSVGISIRITNYMQQMVQERASQVLFIGTSAGNLVPRGNLWCDSVLTCEVCFPIEIHRHLTEGVLY